MSEAVHDSGQGACMDHGWRPFEVPDGPFVFQREPEDDECACDWNVWWDGGHDSVRHHVPTCGAPVAQRYEGEGVDHVWGRPSRGWGKAPYERHDVEACDA